MKTVEHNNSAWMKTPDDQHDLLKSLISLII